MARKKDTFEGEFPTKKVRNISSGKIELVINGVVVIFMPGVVKEIPADFVVPNNIGLLVK